MQEYQSIKEDALKKLAENLSEMQERFEIETIGIFGSVSRGEDTQDSDIDVLYRFKNGSLPLRDFIAFHDYLEALFQRKVDLVSLDFIEPMIQPYVMQDMILYAGEADSENLSLS